MGIKTLNTQNMQEIKELEGWVENILFPKKPYPKEQDSCFYIFHLKEMTTGEKYVIKGDFPGIRIYKKQQLHLEGNFEYSRKYENWQFNVSEAVEIFPDHSEGIIDYLVNYVPNIGNSTAEKLVEKFGETLLEDLQKDPSKADDCAFLSDLQLNSLKKTLKEGRYLKEAAFALQEFKLPPSKVQKVALMFGPSVKFQVENNPYILVETGITSFENCDRIALSRDFSINSEERVRSFLQKVIKDSCYDDGHLFLNFNELYSLIENKVTREISNPFFLSKGLIQELLVLLNAEEKIKLQKIEDKLFIYPYHFYENEKQAGQIISEKLGLSPLFEEDFLRDWVDSFQKTQNMQLNEKQLEAFKILSKSRIGVITGNPGTGKSFLIQCFTNLLKETKKSYLLLGPTGMASKKMSQITGDEAGTIHRILQWNPQKALDGDEDEEPDFSTWGYNMDNPHPAEVVIVDEVSMVDQFLFTKVLEAISKDSVLIILGDSDQLPSVNAGNVLKDLEKSPYVPSVKLDKIMRQNEGSDIVEICSKINQGLIVKRSSMGLKNDVTFVSTDTDSEILSRVISLREKIKEDCQVISPMNRYDLGVNNLNLHLQNVINPNDGEKVVAQIEPGYEIREDDIVVATRNNYKQMFFNGEDGVITFIDNKTQTIGVTLTGFSEPLFLSFKEFQEFFKLSYALSCHKVQGNEYKNIIIPMSHSFGRMLQRNLLYTAISRAREKVYIIGDYSAFCRAIANEEQKRRNSNLHLRIKI